MLIRFLIPCSVAVLLGTGVSIETRALGQETGRAEPQVSSPNVHF